MRSGREAEGERESSPRGLGDAIDWKMLMKAAEWGRSCLHSPPEQPYGHDQRWYWRQREEEYRCVCGSVRVCVCGSVHACECGSVRACGR